MRPILIRIQAVAPLLLLALAGSLVYLRRKRKRSFGYLVCFSIFCVYLIYVLKYTLFPLRLFDTQYAELMRQAGITWLDGLQLVPLRDVSLRYVESVQGLGNILLTLPFGFGLPFLTAVGLREITWRGFLLSASIEFMQLMVNFVYGYRVRAVDVNDIMFNVLGALIGYGIFCFVGWLYRHIVPETKQLPGAWQHIHSVLTKRQNTVDVR